LNWFFTDPPASTTPIRVRVVSRGPLPRDLAPFWYGADKPIELNTGPDAIPLDRGFLSREFLDPRDRAGERLLERAGEARVPALPVAGTQLVVSARVGPESTIPALRAAFSGRGVSAEFSLAVPGVLRTVSFPIPGPDPGMTTAAVEVRPQPLKGSAPRVGQPALLVDRFTVSRLRFLGPPLLVGFGAPAEPYIVEGMYDPETGPGQRPVRWTGGRARLRLPVSPTATGKPWRLNLRLFGPPSAASVPALRVALNGRSLGELPLKPEAEQTLSFPVPGDVLHAGLNELELESAPWRPAELLGADDQRTLGVMLAELEIARAEEAP
jgi:hypothetical protein